MEGDSLYQAIDKKLGKLQLVVVADFLKTGNEGALAVNEMFDEYHVKLYTPSTLEALETNIREHGKLIAE